MNLHQGDSFSWGELKHFWQRGTALCGAVESAGKTYRNATLAFQTIAGAPVAKARAAPPVPAPDFDAIHSKAQEMLDTPTTPLKELKAQFKWMAVEGNIAAAHRV